MTEDQIVKWMREKVQKSGFTDATTLAESFLKEYKISDALDPIFSQSLDAGFKVAQEIRDRRLALQPS